MGNNSNEQEVGQIKLCPFLNDNCIQERCALWTEIGVMKSSLAVVQKQGVCAFTALCMIASIPKAQPAPIRMPPFNLGRG